MFNLLFVYHMCKLLEIDTFILINPLTNNFSELCLI